MNNKLYISLISIFWLVFALFFVFIAITFIDITRYSMEIVVILLFLASIAIIVLTIKANIKGLIKKFFLLTGFSIFGIFISIILHNFIYGIFIYFFGQGFWERVGLGDEPVFFIIGLITCPVAFLIGAIGTIVLLIRQSKKRPE